MLSGPELMQQLHAILTKGWPRHPFVLLDAQPLSGATRMMAEVAQSLDPPTNAIVMEPADLVAAAYRGDFDDLSPYDRNLVWLDDLSPANLLLLDREVIDIITVHAVILGNITTRWRDMLTADTTEVTAETRQTLADVARCFTVPFETSEQERRRARAVMPRVHIGTSIAASLVGADELLRRYDHGLPVFPAARKLAEAAVDIRRLGVHRGLTKRELYNAYAHVTDLRAAARGEFEQAFQWATEIPSGASLGALVSVHEDRWTAAPYLAGVDDGDHGHRVRVLDERRATALLHGLPPNDAFSVAVAAMLRGHHDTARAGFERAEKQCGDPVVHFRALRAAEQLSRYPGAS